MECVRVGKLYRSSESVRQPAEWALQWLQADAVTHQMKSLLDDVHIYNYKTPQVHQQRDKDVTILIFISPRDMFSAAHCCFQWNLSSWEPSVSGFCLRTLAVSGSVLLPAPSPAWLPSWFGCCYLVDTNNSSVPILPQRHRTAQLKDAISTWALW